MDTHEDMATASRSKDIVVFIIRSDAQCAECGIDLFGGSFLRLEQKKPLCMECADLDHLEYLPAGNTAITRRATKHSSLRAVVVKWSRTRKRYERRGILVEPQAITRAEEECQADETVRAERRERAAFRRAEDDQEFITQFAAAIRQQFPGCPKGEDTSIAQHACQKHSGRVGRSAAAKEFDPNAVRLAVIAHIRHAHTDYDRLLGTYANRDLARQQVHGDIDRVLLKWENP